MEAVPIHLREANGFVAWHHRHNLPTVGGKFAEGASVDGKLVGVAIAGRPVARRLDDGKTLEVLRVCTDGTRNPNRFFYGRVKQFALLMGYGKVITCTLASEGARPWGPWAHRGLARCSRRSGACRAAHARARRCRGRPR